MSSTFVEEAPSSADRLPPSRPRRLLGVALALSYVGLGTAVYTGDPVALVAAVALVLGSEGWYIAVSGAGTAAGTDVRWRGWVRGLAAVVFAGVAAPEPRWFALAALGAATFALLNLARTASVRRVRRQRRMPIISRGLDLGPVRVPKGPLPGLVGRGAELPALLDAAVPAGLAIGVLTGSWTLAVAVLAGGAALSVLLLLPVLLAVLAMRRLPVARLRTAVHWALTQANPRVVVHFGGPADALFQLEGWLAAFERLDDSVLVLVRDRAAFRRLGATRLPVLFVADAAELDAVELPELALVLYVSHTANNADLRRRRGVTHAYVGYGDSDKPESTSPLAAGYDEVWVAGPAGRRRLLDDAVRVPDDRIVEIGRPQLDELGTPDPAPAPDYPLFVLYAPTIPGGATPGVNGPVQSSLQTFGVELVRWLLEEPDVCLLYRPHPRVEAAGSRIVRAHREILELLGPDARVPEPADQTARVRDDLALAAAPATLSRTEREAALAVWSRKQLGRARHDQRHLCTPGPWFSPFACFEAADGMICDISGVLSDFVVTGKPYAVANPEGRATYAEQHPTTAGGYIVTPDGRGLDEFLTAARGDGDALRSTRIALRERLIGPAKPPALARMRARVRRLVPEQPGAFIPGPAVGSATDAPPTDAIWKV